jgi:YVTN family beta-propeller protein
MTRLFSIALAIILLLGVVGAVRLSGGGVASQLASVVGIDLGQSETDALGAVTAAPTPVPIEVRVRVRDSVGRAVADAPIEVQDRFGRALVQSVATDTRGEARFIAPPINGVTIRARKAAIGQARATGITIAQPANGEGAMEIDLVLTATAPDPPTPTPNPRAPVATVAPNTPQASTVGATPPLPGGGTATRAPSRAQVAPAPTPVPTRLAFPRRLYVGHTQPRISAIDVASATSVGPPIDLGSGRLTYVAAAASGRRLFTSWGGSSEVVRLRAWDFVEEGRLTLNAGAVAALATSPTDGHLWVATAGAEGQEYSNVIQIDADGTRILRRLDFNRRTGALRFTPDGTILGVAHRSTSEISFVDVASGTPGKPVRLPLWAGDYQFIEDGATILVGNQSTPTIYAIDRVTGEAKRTFDAGSGVAAIASIPGTTRFLVSNSQLGLVQVFDHATGDVRDVIPVGQQPQAILVTEDGRLAYVANTGSASVSAIDLGTMAVTDTIAAGNGAFSLAITPAEVRQPPTSGR